MPRTRGARPIARSPKTSGKVKKTVSRSHKGRSWAPPKREAKEDFGSSFPCGCGGVEIPPSRYVWQEFFQQAIKAARRRATQRFFIMGFFYASPRAFPQHHHVR